MSLCLTENNSHLCSHSSSSSGAESDAGEEPMEQLSSLTRNFRALNLLDGKVGYSNYSPETTAGSECKSKLPIISLDEVAWHDTIDDCWMVICDYVYDCTKFLKNHPGGQDVLLEYAGRDATLAFIGSGHSKRANRLLERFLIGELPLSERIFRTPNGIKIGEFV